MSLNLTRLRTLAELSRRKTLAATAEALGYSAPAVSQQIALLEREAGVSLVERGPRSVRLTEAGRRLAERADQLLSVALAAEREMRQLAGLEVGLVRVAAFPSAAMQIVPELFDEVAGTSGLLIELEDFPPAVSLAALQIGEVDLAVVYDFPDRRLVPSADLLLEPLRDDPFTVCVAADAVEAGKGMIALEDAAALRWIADGGPPAAQCFALRFLGEHGITPTVVARTDDAMVLHRLIAGGVGVALLPDLQARPLSGVTSVPLSAPPAPRRILLAARAGSRANPAIALVAAVLRRLLAADRGSSD